MKRKSKDRTINCNTQTEAEFRAMIINALRGASRWWKPKQECIRKARVGRNQYKCSICGKVGPAKLPAPPGKKRPLQNIVADHIEEIVGPEGFTTYDDWIKRCFVETEGYQALCYECNKTKTQYHQKERRINKTKTL